MSGSIRPELFANSSETNKPNKGGHMAQLTISEAIRRSGIGRTQFYSRYIKKGLISVSEHNGRKYIDSSELVRVFPDLTTEQPPNNTEQTQKHSGEQPQPNNTEQTEQTEQIKLLKEQIADLKADKAFLQSQVVSLTNRLPSPSEKKQNPILKWWNGLE